MINDQSTREYLSTHKFFLDFNDDILNFLNQCSSRHEIKKGIVLFRQGEKADKFYVVRNGIISVQIPAIMGPSLVIQTLGKDQVLGWSWLISPFKWNFQAIAEQDSELFMFDGERVLMRCEQDPKFGYELLKKFAGLMSMRLDAARQKMMDEWNPAGYA